MRAAIRWLATLTRAINFKNQQKQQREYSELAMALNQAETGKKRDAFIFTLNKTRYYRLKIEDLTQRQVDHHYVYVHSAVFAA